ncbi:autotransporter domain-containing protein [Sandaracinobacter sp. RS1-74]|uniref:autotransporter domain-containing protein n=1 Tax=Sandaracinobacteroides sayramensis TaxID=2913411 RepID=UPI001EDB05DE|nr:autotransporter domain-containing protein [Sandaracinobacteroides sayramensis]MCG2841202.1 autotransporter domain-containing protein [Sandaracinobacteroides sayramensis]
MPSVRLLARLSVSAAAMLLAAPAAFAQSDYFFGDSDLEQGNFQIIGGLTPEDRAPYYCEGGLCRDSNGPAWIEHVSPGVVPALAAEPPYRSLNFAVSGAHMTGRGSDDLPVDSGVTRQIELFAQLQDSGAIRVGGDDRFFIHAGTNDLTRLLAEDAPEAIQADIVTAATGHVATLGARGARTIVVATVQPVQYLPMLGGDELAGLRGAIGGLVDDINADLVASLTALRPTLPTGTNIILVDQGAFFEHLHRDHAKLGFSTFDTPCYDADTTGLCSTDPAAQDAHVFFDSNHLTAAGHRLLADWYRATLHAASGEAARDAGRMMDAVFGSADRIARETDAARALFASSGTGPFLFAAPIFATTRYDGDAGNGLRLRQRGGLLGVQWSLGAHGFAALSGAWLEQRARIEAADSFKAREWSVSGVAGMTLGDAASVALHASYARPRFTGFARDAHALDLVARGETKGERYGVGVALAGGTMLAPGLRLSSQSRLDYVHGRIDGFAEQGADGLALRYDRQSADVLALDTRARLGLALVDRPGRLSIIPYVELRDRELLAGDTHRIGSTLIGNIANSATLRSKTLFGQGLTLGGGADLAIGGKLRLGLSYERAVSGPGERSHAAALRLAVAL